MKWNTQAGFITANLNFKMDFTLPGFREKEILTCNFHVDDSAKGRYDIILAKDILTALGLNLEFFYHVIEEYYGPFKGYTLTMVDMGTY